MRRTTRRTLVAILTAIAAGSVLPAAAVAAPGDLFGSGTVVVTPDAPNRFAGTYDRGAGERAFTARLGAPPDGGTGALELRTPGPDDKIQFITDEVAGSLERFDFASYWAVRAPSSTGDALPSFQIATDIDGGELGPGELYLLTYVPDTGSAEHWTRYDLGAGRWCVRQQIGADDAYRACRDGGERFTLAEIRDAHPAMTAYAAGVNQGAGDSGLVGAVDLIQVGDRTYDIEPTTP